MSLSDFYIDNGIDPTDPDSMDFFLATSGVRGDSRGTGNSNAECFSGFCEIRGGGNGSGTSTEASNYVLNESELDEIAEARGWTKVDASTSTAPMASYKLNDCRLNFWLTTGTVGSYLEHPRQGKTQLFRRAIDQGGAAQIFSNPRQHTGRGYRRRRNRRQRQRNNRGGRRNGDRHQPY